MGEMINACKVLVDKPGGKRPLGKHRRTLNNHIKTDMKQIRWVSAGWINFDQGK
jgi:hypothetical protein